jgi:hypothetical protein
MNEVLRPQSVTSTATLLDMLAGGAQREPTIITAAEVRLKSGGTRIVTAKIPVPDAGLFARLAAEAEKGDKVRITVETDWSDPALPRRLTAFAVVSSRLAHTSSR